MSAMTRDWTRLGLAIKARREELGMPTQQALADAAGVKRQTIQALESGKQRSRMPGTIGRVEEALGWEPGTAARVLSGEDEKPQNGATARLAEGMPARIAQELSAGQVVDTEIVDLPLPGTPFKLVGILKHDAAGTEASPEEMARVLREWSRVQRMLREIGNDREGPSDHN